MARQRPPKRVRVALAAQREFLAKRQAYAETHDERVKGITQTRGMWHAFENPRRATGKEPSVKWGWHGNIAKGLHQKGRVWE